MAVMPLTNSTCCSAVLANAPMPTAGVPLKVKFVSPVFLKAAAPIDTSWLGASKMTAVSSGLSWKAPSPIVWSVEGMIRVPLRFADS